MLGSGEGNKWRVKWTLPGGTDIVAQHGKRVLSLDLPDGIDDGDNSDMSLATGDGGSDGSRDEELDVDERELDPEEDPEEDNPNEADLCPNGHWWHFEESGVIFDARENKQSRKQTPHVNWSAIFPHAKEITERPLLMYFCAFLPPKLVQICVTETNKELVKRGKKPTTLHELFKVIGIIFAIGFQPTRNRRDHSGAGTDRLFPHVDFKVKWGVCLHRWEKIMAAWRWTDTPGSGDRWWPCRMFVNLFNEWMPKFFCPGWVLCIDESTTRWKGFPDWHPNGCPHRTSIPRKPESLSIEIRDACCGVSQVCMFLEIQEGKEAMRNKEFCDGARPAGTAFALRATKQYQGSGRVVVGDSAFASVPTAIGLFQVGLFFIGLVKTAHKYFPIKFLKMVAMGDRGSSATCLTAKDGVSLIGHVWKDWGKNGKDRKAFISTCGTSLPGKPAVRPRTDINEETRQVTPVELVIPRTNIVETYFDHAGAIDRFNHARQDGFRLERNILVQTWDRRMIFSLLGYVGANAFFAYQLEGGDKSLSEFIEKLCIELGENELEGSLSQNDISTRGGAASGNSIFTSGELPEATAAVGIQEPLSVQHIIRQLSWLTRFSTHKQPKSKFQICHDLNARFACLVCSQRRDSKVFALCGSDSHRDCIAIHSQLGYMP